MVVATFTRMTNVPPYVGYKCAAHDIDSHALSVSPRAPLCIGSRESPAQYTTTAAYDPEDPAELAEADDTASQRPPARRSRGRGRGKGHKTAWKPISLASASQFPSLRKAMPRPAGPSHKERLLSEERQINLRQMSEWRYSPAAAHGATPPAPWQFPVEERLLAHAKDLRDGFVAPDLSSGFRDGPSNESIPQSNTTVFVGGLPAEANADVLRLIFGVWGDIEICNIPKGGRGCAFITFYERHSAEDALYFMQGFPLYDSKLRPAWGHDNRTGKTRSRGTFALSDHSDFLADYLNLTDMQRQLLKRFVDEAEGEDFDLFKRVNSAPVPSSSSRASPSITADRFAGYPYKPYRKSPDHLAHSDDDDASSTLPSLTMSSPSSTSTSIAPIPHDRTVGHRSRTPGASHDPSCARFTPAPTTEESKLFAPFTGLSTSATTSPPSFGWSSSGVYPTFTPTFSPPKPRQLPTESSTPLGGTPRRLSAEEAAAKAWKDCGCPDHTEVRPLPR